MDLTSDLKDLAELAASEEVDDLVRRGLDWISRLAPYDLAALIAIVSAEQRTALARLWRARRADAKLLEDELGGASGAGLDTTLQSKMKKLGVAVRAS